MTTDATAREDTPAPEEDTDDSPSSNGGGKRLVIVESPAKARTIERFLGPDYIVESSIGHIRDLPSKAAEIPKQYKKEAWSRLGVNVDRNFEPIYVIPADKQAQVRTLRKLLKDADELYLATDEDREGEAIAWHLSQVLKPKVPVHRMVFHEITQRAIEEALEQPREIDQHLVQAQEARRILDRLYGYEVSPVLWKKVKPRLSAGRVQSAAIRLIVERERQRMRFVSAGYWDVDATAAVRDAATPVTVGARMVELGGRRLASGRDFDPETGELTSEGSVVALDESTARSAAEAVSSATFTVTEVVERPYTQRPPAPFITSTLQQEAGRKLRYSAQRTMQVAQSLYENGHITYMRTDSTALSNEAINGARAQVGELYGSEFLPDQPRRYQTSSRGAQEAHEAIRPAGDRFRTPESLRSQLTDDGFRLYDLIWKRTVASQMRDATGLRTNVRLQAEAGEHGTAEFTLSGKVITFPGFLRAYVEGSDDPDAELEDQERILPALSEGQQLDGAGAEARGHETQPPNRYTEAALVRELEERGIGRPSTYASIIQTIQDRGYVWKKSNTLVPTYTAFAVVNLLHKHFPGLIDLDFTARMEDELDAVAAGDVEAIPWLRRFYFGDDNAPDDDSLASAGLKERIGAGWEEIDARGVSSIPLGVDEEGREIAVRVGRYGPYVQAGDEPLRASVPDDQAPDELGLDEALEVLRRAALGDTVITTDSESGKPVYLKTGRYGPYVQLGDDDENDGKPKRASLWPDMSMETLTPEQAMTLLSFPRVLGTHPESNEPVTVQNGPNGPYVRSGTESRSLDDYEQLQSITLDEAVRVLAQPRRGRGRAASVLAVLGKDPERGNTIEVRSGRFGPYVTDGQVNASLPRGREPQSMTLEQALDLIAAREERLRAQGTDPRAPKPARRGRGGKSSRSRTSTRRTRRKSA